MPGALPKAILAGHTLLLEQPQLQTESAGLDSIRTKYICSNRHVVGWKTWKSYPAKMDGKVATATVDLAKTYVVTEN